MHAIRQGIVRYGVCPVILRFDRPIQSIGRSGGNRVLSCNAILICFAGQRFCNTGLDGAANQRYLGCKPLSIVCSAGKAEVFRLSVGPHIAATVVRRILVASGRGDFTSIVYNDPAIIEVVIGHRNDIQCRIIGVRRIVCLADIGEINGLTRFQIAHIPILIVRNRITR